VPVEIAGAPQLGGRAIRVYIALCSFADAKGECYPSHRLLMEMTRIDDRRGFSREIAALVNAGLVEIEHRRRNDGGSSSNLYRIIHRCSHTPASPEAHTPASPEAHTPASPEAQEREPRTFLTDQFEQGTAPDHGRSAPLHSSGAVAHPEPAHPEAYAAAAKANKRRNWLRSLNAFAATIFRGRQLEAAWEAIQEAERAGSWSATPEHSRSFLDRLDRLRLRGKSGAR
jgi:hypothetical protein